MNSRVAAADHTEEIEAWVGGMTAATRFDEVSVKLENCVLVARRAAIKYSEGAKRGQLYVEVRDEFVTPIATTRIAYDAFLDGMSQADREAPMSKVSPFFKDQQVARLPQYSISQGCRRGEYLGIERRRFVIWIAGPDIEAAPKAFAEHIKSCRR